MGIASLNTILRDGRYAGITRQRYPSLGLAWDGGALNGLRTLSLTLSLKGEGTVRSAWVFLS